MYALPTRHDALAIRATMASLMMRLDQRIWCSMRSQRVRVKK